MARLAPIMSTPRRQRSLLLNTRTAPLADDAPSDDGPEQATDSEHAGEAANGEASGDADEERFPIVGIGASAGGIGALEAFFEPLPSGLDMAFVVVQHLSREHESRLADLLQGHTEMLVEQVEETVALEPGHVYVIPPGKNRSSRPATRP